MPNSDAIEFECPRCTTSIQVQPELVGKRTECPACQGEIIVPLNYSKPESKPGLFEDIFDETLESEPKPATPQQSSEAASPFDDLDSIPLETPVELEEISLTPEPPAQVNSAKKTNEAEYGELEPLDDTEGLEGSRKSDEINVDEPLRIEGLEDLYGHEDVAGLKCNVCDTRVQIRLDQVGDYVECPVCFTKIAVKKSRLKKAGPKNADKTSQSKDTAKQTPVIPAQDSSDELRLADPVELPAEVVDKSAGMMEEPLELEPIDLVDQGQTPIDDFEEAEDVASLTGPDAPPAPTDIENIPDLEVINDNAFKPAVVPRSKKAQKKAAPKQPKKVVGKKAAEKKASGNNQKQRDPRRMSRRERYEETQRLAREKEQATAFEVEIGDTDREETEYPTFSVSDMGDLFSAILSMIGSRGLVWRTIIATCLLCLGSIIFMTITGDFFVDPNAVDVIDVEKNKIDGSLIESIKHWTRAGLLGGVPYTIGLFGLWYICSFIFREAALGQREIKSWKHHSANDFMGTLLLFGFSFLIAGLPALFLTIAILPLRMLLAPLLLLGAWYNQSPFQIVNAIIFKNMPREMGQWTAFYMFVGGLAFLGVIAGLIFWARFFIGIFAAAILLNIMAVILTVGITLVFAAVTGWHCGQVVESLENTGN